RQSPKTVRNGGFAACNPDGVGDNDGIGSNARDVVPGKVFEIRAADFFLEFPDELNVDRSAMLDRVSCAEKRGQSRAFIVRRSSTDVPIAFLMEHEWRTRPLGLIRGLHIEMVVDRDGPPV